MPRNTKKIYENYTDELIILKFKLLNIYYIINGVKPKAPSGALRLFLQVKVKENAISSNIFYTHIIKSLIYHII